ncbi:hypothetical protein FAIPA1_30225 [Frankia sp. AiPs1]
MGCPQNPHEWCATDGTPHPREALAGPTPHHIGSYLQTISELRVTGCGQHAHRYGYHWVRIGLRRPAIASGPVPADLAGCPAAMMRDP